MKRRQFCPRRLVPGAGGEVSATSLPAPAGALGAARRVGTHDLPDGVQRDALRRGGIHFEG